MNYLLNVTDYLDETFLEEETYKIGDDVLFLPEEENDANFCSLKSIDLKDNFFITTFMIENEWTGEKYARTYNFQPGSKIGMNMLGPNLACFLPPKKIPVLVEITAISAEHIVFKVIGVQKQYAKNIDKKAALLKSQI